jgi:radical SAM superfamily enzyme YgiQ (UPF0313 family)
MQVLLVAPSSGRWRGVGRGRLFNGRTFRFSLLSLLAVAAETPEEVDVQIVDEQVDEVPLRGDFDLVGITCMTALAPRAYRLAAAFRRRGIPVVLGGLHPTLCPEEARQHADSVVVGEAEGVWRTLLADLALGRLRPLYRAGATGPVFRRGRLPRGRLEARHYAPVHAVQATRGCPHRCEFCSVSAASGGRQVRRPVDEVVDEIAGLPGRRFIFVDDNLVADREYASELFDRLTPLNRRWVTQCTLRAAEETDLLARMAGAGCVGVFVGLETFSESNLIGVGKDCHRVQQYRDRVGRFHAAGIGVEAGIVFGFDRDTPRVFADTLSHLEELAIDAIQVSILTPLPGTPLYRRVADRIIDRDWSHYDFHHVVFEPRGMSPAQLQAGHDWVTREFYRPGRIARRTLRYLGQPRGLETLGFFLAINLAYYGRVLRWGIRGQDPADATTRAPRLRSAA